jgi:hypothetical protein
MPEYTSTNSGNKLTQVVVLRQVRNAVALAQVIDADGDVGQG